MSEKSGQHIRGRYSFNLRRFSNEETKYCMDQWHHNGVFGSAKDMFGAELDGKLIAAVAYIDFRGGDHPDVGELMATVRNTEVPFQMSQLIAYSRKQLKDKYDLLVTFYQSIQSKGKQCQGDLWKYHGIIVHMNLNKLVRTHNGMHLYWIPLNERGLEKANSLGLEANPYPK